MLNRWDREDGRTPEEIARGLKKARRDFERAGLLPVKKAKRKAR